MKFKSLHKAEPNDSDEKPKVESPAVGSPAVGSPAVGSPAVGSPVPKGKEHNPPKARHRSSDGERGEGN